MATRVRCRCPLCGMLVTQKQLDGEHEFEFKIQFTGSRGRGKIYHAYRKPDKVEGEVFLVFKLALVQKLHDVADRLFESLHAGAKKKRETGEDDERFVPLIPPVEVAPSVVRESSGGVSFEPELVDDLVPVLVTEVVPDVRMGGESAWESSVDLGVESELCPRTVMD